MIFESALTSFAYFLHLIVDNIVMVHYSFVYIKSTRKIENMKSIQQLLDNPMAQMQSSQDEIDAAKRDHELGKITDAELAEIKRREYKRFFKSFGVN